MESQELFRLGEKSEAVAKFPLKLNPDTAGEELVKALLCAAL